MPPTGITDYGVVARTLAAQLAKKGVDVRFRAKVTTLASNGSEVRIVAGGEHVAAGTPSRARASRRTASRASTASTPA